MAGDMSAREVNALVGVVGVDDHEVKKDLRKFKAYVEGEQRRLRASR